MPIEINEKEYARLFNENIDNKTSWKFKSNLYVNSFINDIFEENKFFYAIIFDKKYNILKNNSNTQFLDDLRKYFDHYYSVSFKQSVSHIEHPETITGIMDFPNIEWNTISQIITKLPGDGKFL